MENLRAQSKNLEDDNEIDDILNDNSIKRRIGKYCKNISEDCLDIKQVINCMKIVENNVIKNDQLLLMS